MRALTAFSGVLAALMVVATASSQAQPVETKLLPADGRADQQFGGSVSLSGRVAAVGAFADDDNGTSAGAVYIYRFDGATWVEEAKLLASDGTAQDQFGISVAVEGDTLVVGARGDDDNGPNSGSIYLYRFDGATWVEEAKLLPSDGARDDLFGTTIAISGDALVVGAQGADGNAHNSGAAYVFRFDGEAWVEEAKLIASDGADDDYLYRVAISDDTIVAGAFGDDDYGSFSGAAYVFRFNGTTWVEEAKLIASDGVAYDYFSPVAISGNTVVVGAVGADGNVEDSGAAYVYRFDGTHWVQEAKLVAYDGERRQSFGSAVALSDRTLVVGAFGPVSSGSGAAYVFHFDGASWAEAGKLVRHDGGVGTHFGHPLVASGNAALIGARNDYENGPGSGSAYLFEGLIPPLAAAIDIKPGSDTNAINPFSRGVIPVAILGSETFDMNEVDAATLAFGPDGASPVHDLTEPSELADHLCDVNDDELTDLVSHYRTQETGIAAGDTEACLTGETLDGIAFEGCDAIVTQTPSGNCGVGAELAMLLPTIMWLTWRRRHRV